MNTKHIGVAKLWLLNLFGNAALMAAIYFLLILPDAHGWQVALSALLALIVIFFGVWLRAGSFAYFRLTEFRDHALVWRAFHHALRHLVALLLWFLPFAAVVWWLFGLRRFAPQFGVWFWQKFPLLHFGSPRHTYRAAEWAIWVAVLLLFAAWLPIASTVSAVGLKPSHMARSLGVLKRLSCYWTWLVGLLVVGLYLPGRLIWWIPDLGTLKQQAWSAGGRFFLAYLLLISAWIGLLLIAGTRTEMEDPDSTGQPSSNSDARGI